MRGTVLTAPDTRNSPITAAYVITHRIQTIFSMNKRRVPEVQDHGQRERRAGEQIPGTLSRTAGRAVSPAIESNAANANQIAPKIATGTPPTDPYRLE